MQIYFANSLFSQADQTFNQTTVAMIRATYPGTTVYLPQENAAINDKQAYADSKMIAQADTDEVLKSQLLIAVLDGVTIDAGVASEIGVAYAKQIPILGLYTDTRQQGAENQKKLTALQTIAENQFHYLNLYTTGLIKLNGAIYNNIADLIQNIGQYLQK
ncbi:nucleoside 2-deoxyribosyltransferase [Agrilactobacillus fermenti]|uniref:nucleoside 2-deoxyribosyltransferase n=1 Tax=Agrilactobacillus fermenti TaxID=2586909 RepID=UPI001E5D67F0|nr:nucleoside 2-deoxyribosyltransferase [Agrilactobacillus fermenti]MCD2255184.1 nucleoside 2-deoxyribosyltransferase [Agrilactobacillus fermenti]